MLLEIKNNHIILLEDEFLISNFRGILQTLNNLNFTQITLLNNSVVKISSLEKMESYLAEITQTLSQLPLSSYFANSFLNITNMLENPEILLFC
jgi:hypothetical protein